MPVNAITIPACDRERFAAHGTLTEDTSTVSRSKVKTGRSTSAARTIAVSPYTKRQTFMRRLGKSLVFELVSRLPVHGGGQRDRFMPEPDVPRFSWSGCYVGPFGAPRASAANTRAAS